MAEQSEEQQEKQASRERDRRRGARQSRTTTSRAIWPCSPRTPCFSRRGFRRPGRRGAPTPGYASSSAVARRVARLQHDETEAVGDLAFHRFSYSWRLEPKSGGQLQVSHGKGLHILRRYGDGNWKIAREAWNDRPTPNTL